MWALIGDYFALMRPRNSLLVGFAVIVGELLAVRTFPSLSDAVTGFLVGFLISAGAMVTNDIFDIEVDRVNAPYRPLPRGTVTIPAAIALAIALYGGGIAVAFTISAPCLFLTAAFAALSLAYNCCLKKAGLLGNAVVSLSVAVPYVFGALVVGRLTELVLIFAAISFITNLGREVVKGIPDIPGDAIRGVMTIARTRGPGFACKFAAICVALGVAASPVPPILGLTGSLYIPAVTLADVILLSAVRDILRDCSAETAIKVKGRIFAGMLVGLLAFVIGGLSL